MYICYSNIDKKIIHIPEHVSWTLECRPFDDEGNGDGSMYLIVEGKEYVIRDPDYWCMGRRNLPYHIVGYFYEDMLNVIMEKLANNPQVINIDKIENEMIENQYKKEWLDKGYIEIDDHGRW